MIVLLFFCMSLSFNNLKTNIINTSIIYLWKPLNAKPHSLLEGFLSVVATASFTPTTPFSVLKAATLSFHVSTLFIYEFWTLFFTLVLLLVPIPFSLMFSLAKGLDSLPNPLIPPFPRTCGGTPPNTPAAVVFARASTLPGSSLSPTAPFSPPKGRLSCTAWQD